MKSLFSFETVLGDERTGSAHILPMLNTGSGLDLEPPSCLTFVFVEASR